MTTSRIFDFELFSERMMEDDELMAEVAIAMLEDTPVQIELLKKLVDERKLQEAGRAGHKIKGGASNLCCRELEESALMVEHAGKAEDEEKLLSSANLLYEAWERLEPVLQNRWKKN